MCKAVLIIVPPFGVAPAGRFTEPSPNGEFVRS